MSDFSGDATYDAATANWGSSWRMPTSTEIKELVSECTWRPNSSYAAMTAYKVIGPNGKYIIMPCYSRTLQEGQYWSSTPKSDNEKAYLLYFDNSANIYLTSLYRNQFKVIRPVVAD